MSFDQDEMDEYEQALEDTSMRALMVAQTQELREIRYQLQVLTDALTAEVEAPETLVCGFCGDEVAKEDRREHLTESHNAPEGVALDEVYIT